MATLMERVKRRLERYRYMSGPHIRKRALYLERVAGKRGLEVGGPSDVFRPDCPLDLYAAVGGLDNCDFSNSTVWQAHLEPEYRFHPEKEAGRSMFCEGTNLATVADGSYDFVLSSHNLEHFANPVKALREWKRILRPGGVLILALPNYRRTFDHRRKPTSVDHMLDDFTHNVGEDDLTHLPEIFALHDRSRDPASGTQEYFENRSRKNIENRCLHHHVFDMHNSRALLEQVGYRVHSVELAYPVHILLLATCNED